MPRKHKSTRHGVLYLRLTEKLKNRFKVYCAERAIPMNQKVEEMIKKEIQERGRY